MRIRHWHARTKERDVHLSHLCAGRATRGARQRVRPEGKAARQLPTCRSPEMTTSVTLARVIRLVSAPRRSSGDMADLGGRAEGAQQRGRRGSCFARLTTHRTRLSLSISRDSSRMICCDTRCVRRGLAIATAAPGQQWRWRQRSVWQHHTPPCACVHAAGRPGAAAIHGSTRTMPLLSHGANTRAGHQERQAGRAGKSAGLRGQPSRLMQAGERQCPGSASGACPARRAASGCESTPTGLLCYGHRDNPG